MIRKQRKCSFSADIAFLLDNSGNMRSRFNKLKRIVKELAVNADVSENGTRVGVVSFNSKARVDIKLNDHDNIDDFNKGVDNVRMLGHLNRIDKALTVVQNEFFTKTNGARRGVPKVVVLLTDSSQTYVQGSKVGGGWIDTFL